MRVLATFLTLLALVVPLSGRAQQSPVVIELFTSQGCSSCPPADALLAELAPGADIVALSLHVDYWDYLGWRDTLADPAFTKRQKAYAKSMHKRSLFTPQLIVQGQDMLIGHDAEAIRASIAAHQAIPQTVALTLERKDGTLRILLVPIGAGAGQLDVNVVRFAPSVVVDIPRGENSGRSITYTNVVTDWDTVAQWDGTSKADVAVEGIGTDAIAVIVQRERLGPVVSAAVLW